MENTIIKPPYIYITPNMLVKHFLDSYFVTFFINTDNEMFNKNQIEFLIDCSGIEKVNLFKLIKSIEKKYFVSGQVYKYKIHSFKSKQYYIIKGIELCDL